MRRNYVLGELRVTRLAVIQEEICCKTSCSDLDWIGNQLSGNERKIVMPIPKEKYSQAELARSKPP